MLVWRVSNRHRDELRRPRLQKRRLPFAYSNSPDPSLAIATLLNPHLISTVPTPVLISLPHRTAPQIGDRRLSTSSAPGMTSHQGVFPSTLIGPGYNPDLKPQPESRHFTQAGRASAGNAYLRKRKRTTQPSSCILSKLTAGAQRISHEGESAVNLRSLQCTVT